MGWRDRWQRAVFSSKRRPRTVKKESTSTGPGNEVGGLPPASSASRITHGRSIPVLRQPVENRCLQVLEGSNVSMTIMFPVQVGSVHGRQLIACNCFLKCKCDRMRKISMSLGGILDIGNGGGQIPNASNLSRKDVTEMQTKWG